MVIQVYDPTSNAEEAEWLYEEDLQDRLELIPEKDVLFIIGDWNAKVVSQKTPGITGKFGLGIWNEAGQRQKRRLFTWTSPDGQHQNQIDYILCCQRWRTVNKNKTRS